MTAARSRTGVRGLSVLVLGLAVTAAAPGGGAGTAAEPDGPVCADGQFLAEYFAEVDLQGPPVVVACEDGIDADWGTGRAHPRVPEDRFSARWSADVALPAGLYRFTAGTDDGVRLRVDEQLVIDAWEPRPLRTSVAVGVLEAGTHRIVMEYFEQAGLAAARLRWERSPSGWFTSAEQHPGHWPETAAAPPGPADAPPSDGA